MHHRHRLGKQICRNIQPASGLHSSICFTNSLIYFFQSSFRIDNFPHTRRSLQIWKQAEVSCDNICASVISGICLSICSVFSRNFFVLPRLLRTPTDTRSPAFAHILPDHLACTRHLPRLATVIRALLLWKNPCGWDLQPFAASSFFKPQRLLWKTAFVIYEIRFLLWLDTI